MIQEREKERYREMSSDRLTSSPSPQTPQNEDQLKQKRKRTTYTIFGLIVALIASTLVAVSYTHLTLPTIYSV